MPLHKLYKKYRASELALLAWRSGEIASNMHHQRGVMSDNSTGDAPAYAEGNSSVGMDGIERALGSTIVDKLNKHDMDMRKLTGEEFCHYASVFKIPLGMSRLAKMMPPATVEEAKIREAYRRDA